MIRWLAGCALLLVLAGCSSPRAAPVQAVVPPPPMPAAEPPPSVPAGVPSPAATDYLTVPRNPRRPLAGRHIVLDPGHGGSNPGARAANGLRETDVNADVALRLAPLLRAQGATVSLTRTADVDLDLGTRPAMANQERASLFISLHANWNQDPKVSGTSVYVCRACDNREASLTLAAEVQRALVEELGLPDLGVLEANFKVLREAAMPAILVEAAFLSNEREAALLADPSFRQRVAAGVATGVVRHALASQHPLARPVR